MNFSRNAKHFFTGDTLKRKHVSFSLPQRPQTSSSEEKNRINIVQNCQIRVLSKDTSTICNGNEPSSVCFEDNHSEKPKPINNNLFFDEDEDLIDGKIIYSFATKSNMELFFKTYGKTASTSPNCDASKDNSVVPRKTFNGRREKHFAIDDVPSEMHETNKGHQNWKRRKEDIPQSRRTTKKKMPNSVSENAFVSDALDAYLKDESELNILFLRELCPNVIPIPRSDPILLLRYWTERKNKLHQTSRFLKPQPNSSAIQNGTVVNSGSLKSSSEAPLSRKMRSRKAASLRSKNSKDSASTHRLKLRLRRDPRDSGAYKIMDMSTENKFNPKEQKKDIVSPRKLKSSLLRIRALNQNLLDEFLKNLGRSGTRNDDAQMKSECAPLDSEILTPNDAERSVQTVISFQALVESQRKSLWSTSSYIERLCKQKRGVPQNRNDRVT